MILAAGRGERMRPLTDDCPKPLLRAGGRMLVEHTIRALVRAGIVDLVINHAWLGARIEAALGDGTRHGASIRYSPEPAGALETAGGIRRALALLGAAPFVAVNADIWTDYDFARLPAAPPEQAHLILVDNPDHNPGGDFALQGEQVLPDGRPKLTFSGIGVYRPEMFSDLDAPRAALGSLLRRLAARGRVTGEHHAGGWMDIGTPERLAALDARLRADGSEPRRGDR